MLLSHGFTLLQASKGVHGGTYTKALASLKHYTPALISELEQASTALSHKLGQSSLVAKMYEYTQDWQKEHFGNDNNWIACQPRLTACGASLYLPGRLLLSNLLGTRQTRDKYQSEHIIQTILSLLA